MTITRRPSRLSLTGNLLPINIEGAAAEVTLTLAYEQGDTIFSHTYTPTAAGTIEVQLRDIIRPLLTLEIRDTDAPYIQERICGEFKVTLTEHTETPYTNVFSFFAIRAGVDHFDGSAATFLKQNFLTWQPNTKRVTYYTPEFLTYYAQDTANIRCTAYGADGAVLATAIIDTLNGNECHTIPVQYATILAALRRADPGCTPPSYYDIQAEDGQGNRLTYVQRYVADILQTDEEQWVLFENSLGGIDTFRAYGDTESTASHTHNIAEIEETLTEYRIDTERTHRKSTGALDARERVWLLDFFPSTGKYIYLPNNPIQPILPIIVTESDVSYSAAAAPSAYTFTYRYAQDRPLLNIPRTEAPQEVLEINAPTDDASFTLAPRLAEFPRLLLSGGALLPVQSPYSGEWSATSLSAVADYLIENITVGAIGGGVGHTHNNIALLNAIAYIDGYLSVMGQKTKAGEADHAAKAADIDDDSPAYRRFLRKDTEDAAAEILSFLKGTTHGDPGLPEAVIGNAEKIREMAAGGKIPINPINSTNPQESPVASFIRSLYTPRLEAASIQSRDTTTHNLMVTGIAHFFELVIDKIRATAGAQVITPADGFKVAATLPLDLPAPADPDNLHGETIDGKRLYFHASDADGNAIANMWKAGDQALCRSFNQARTGVSYHVENKYYWALVAGTDNDEQGNSVPEIIDIDGQATPCHYIDIYTGDGGETPETMPTDTGGLPLWDGEPTKAAAGDEIAMLGHRVQADETENGEPSSDATARQSAIVMSAYSQLDAGLKPPFLAFYRGVCDFNLPTHRKTFFDARRNALYGEFYSTTNNEAGTPIESYLSGTEFDIIYGDGSPLTTHPEAEWSANEYPLHDKTLYYDTQKTPASSGGRLWKWLAADGTWQWQEITDADTSAALEKIAQLQGEYNTFIQQNSKEIILAAMRGNLLAAGITINGEYESVTINGRKTSIEGDLDVKGLITESSRFIDWFDEDFSVFPVNPANPIDPTDPSDFIGTSLFIPLDLDTVKSISVSPTSRESDGSGSPRYGATAIVALPMYGDTTINGAAAIPGHRLSGTHITIRNAYSPFFAHWQQLQGAGKFAAVNGAVLICADPRVLDASNYGAAADGSGGQSAAAIPIAEGGYSQQRAHGNIVANGRRAKFLLLLPGQSVEFVSSVERYGTDINGVYGTEPYLSWYVTGDSHRPVAARVEIIGTNDQGDEIDHTADFTPSVTYISESDPHAGSAFLAPPEMGETQDGGKMEILIRSDYGKRPHT